MEESRTIINLNQNKELKYLDNKYNFEKIFAIPLIINQIFLFMNKNDAKSLSLCSKKIYLLYNNQIKEIKINEEIESTKMLNIILDKYKNILKLDLSKCKNINDFSFISNLEKLENLNISNTKIFDISFIEKNRNIKELDLKGCKSIKDYSFISNLEKLEKLNLSNIKITDVPFLEKNKNIKELDLKGCDNIKDYSFISNIEKLEKLNLSNSKISDISFLAKI